VSNAVDWDLAVSTGARLAPRGPRDDRASIDAAVRQIRRASERAVQPVSDVTGMESPFEAHRSVVVGRREWVRSNVDQLRIVTEPVVDRLSGGTPGARMIGSRVAAVQMGSVLGWLSGKVLGQYEVFGVAPRLLLIAPNIVHTERQLNVPSVDFRLWVCLHEETHRVQFGAVPWLSSHFTEQVHTYLASMDTDASSALMRILTAIRGRSRDELSLIDLVQTPEQREILDGLTALMSLLEGHADVVMDAVGPRIVPSVDVIRERFNQRRQHAGTLDGALRRLLGLNAKLRQYVEGAAFVRGVVDRVGMSGFNAVWTSPATLPRPAEIANPQAWVARVHG
jgi:coenzyme F420 biosynthesis associated uncharacterized protein